MQPRYRKFQKFSILQIIIIALILLGASHPITHAGWQTETGISPHQAFFTSTSVHDPFHIWSKSFGSPGYTRGNSVAVDSMGNVFITGEFWLDIDFGGGPLQSREMGDIFLAKFDSIGNHLWSKRFGADFYDGGSSVAVDSNGNVFLTGYLSETVDFGGGPISSFWGTEDAFLAKFDSNGNHLWSMSFGGNGDDHGNGLAVDANGNIIIVGYFSKTIGLGGNWFFSNGLHDIFIAKFDENGSHLWSKSFGGPEDDFGKAVSIESTGDILISGVFENAVSFGGDQLTSSGNADIFLARYNLDGNHVWSKRFGGVEKDNAASMISDLTGSLYITGYLNQSLATASNGDTFLLKVDSDGEQVWTKNFVSPGSEFGTGLSLDSEGNVFLMGYFDLNMNLGGNTLTAANETFDIFLAKYDANGQHLFSERFGSTGHDYVRAVVSDSNGGLYITGNCGSVNFGGGELPGETGNDVFLVKFDRSSNLYLPLVSQ